MPRGDRTGPDGLGPMTGRAAGFCAGYAAPGYMNPVGGRGRGRGFGRGMGIGFHGRNNFYPAYGYGAAFPNATPYAMAMTSAQEIDMLHQQAQSLEQTLTQINQRITELEKQKEEK